MWRSYFSFFKGEKAANNELFKDFSTWEKWKRTRSNGGLYFVIVP